MRKKVIIITLVIVGIAGCLLLTMQLNNLDFHNLMRSMHGG